MSNIQFNPLTAIVTIVAGGVLAVTFARFAFWVGRTIRASGKAVIATGIATAQSGFFGRPEQDTKLPKFFGYTFLFASYLWTGAGWFALVMAVMMTVGILAQLF